VSSALTLALVVMLAQQNAPFPYELRIERGMPAKWQS
jgi:hypothetical protein